MTFLLISHLSTLVLEKHRFVHRPKTSEENRNVVLFCYADKASDCFKKTGGYSKKAGFQLLNSPSAKGFECCFSGGCFQSIQSVLDLIKPLNLIRGIQVK